MADPIVAERDDLVVLDETPARPDLPTPAEVIAAEENKPAAETPVETPVETPAEPVAIASEETLAMIELKINAGEELTEEEKAITAKIEESMKEPEIPPAPVKESVFKIGKDEFTSSQIEEKMRTDLNIGKIDLSAEAKEKMIQMYVKSQNRSEAQVAVAKGFEENAQERHQLALERQRLEGIARSTAERETRLMAKVQKLQKVASNPVEQKDVYNELNQVDVIKLGQFQDKNRAIEELQEVNEELESIKAQKTDTQRQVRIAMLNEFTAVHPEFKTAAAIEDIATNINKGLPVDPDDEMKVLELTRLMDEAAYRGLTLEKIYTVESRRGTLAVKPAAQSAPEPPKIPTTLPKPPKPLAQKIADFRAKNSKATPGTSSPGAPMPPAKPSNAAELIRSDQRTLGMNNADPLVRSIGY